MVRSSGRSGANTPGESNGDAEDGQDTEGLPAPARPVAVLDACVLVPAGLRDLLLSCADLKVFRPVWQDEILGEVRRNGSRLLRERNGLAAEDSERAIDHTLNQMQRAFPDAAAESDLWVPLVPTMRNDTKDRHVLAVAQGAGATHLVTINLHDFPPSSRPAGVAVIHPDPFLLERYAETPDLVVDAVHAMSRRLKSPPISVLELANQLSAGQFTPQFGQRLKAHLLDS